MAYYNLLTMHNPEEEELLKVIEKFDPSKTNVTRTFNALVRNGVRSVEELCRADEDDIADFRCIGKKSMKIIGLIREEMGYTSEYVNPQAHSLHVAKIPGDIWDELSKYGEPNELLLKIAKEYLEFQEVFV